jgi:DNA polymerase-3 subunit alpha
MRASQVTPQSVQQLKEILQAYPGATEVHLRVRGQTKTTVYRLGYRINVRPEFWADLKAAVAVKRAT